MRTVDWILAIMAVTAFVAYIMAIYHLFRLWAWAVTGKWWGQDRTKP